MKLLLPLFGVCLLGSCATQPALPPHDRRGDSASNLRAVGARNSAGVPVGEYLIVNTIRGGTQTQGRYQHGKMDGKWVFFDSQRIKVAEITYQDGVATGPYKTYFSSFLIPSAAGKLESEGRFQKGQVVGRHLAYSANGQVFSVATFEAGKLRRVEAGLADAATKTADADARFLQVLEGTVRAVVR